MRRVILAKPLDKDALLASGQVITRPLTKASRGLSKTKNSPDKRGRGVGGPKVPPTTPHPYLGSGKESEKDAVSELLDLTSSLTSKQRRELLDRLSLAEHQQSGEGRDLDMWLAAVQTVLVDAERRGMLPCPGLGVLRPMFGSRSSWAKVQEFMAAAKLDELKVIEKKPVYSLLARLAFDHAREVSRRSDAPLSAKLVANCASNVAALFDQEFPDYVASGLAKIVAKRLLAGHSVH